MYAVIETGGKQYRVEVGTELEVERLEFEPGQAITLDRVLLVADGATASVGRPLVTEAVVSAEVLRQDRGEKLISFKYRPKARSRVKKGHRQELTVLRVTDVRLGDRSAAEDARQAKEKQQAEAQQLREVAARQAAADQELAARLAAQAPAVPAGPAKPARGKGRSGSEAAPAASGSAAAESPKRTRVAPKAAPAATPAKPARAPRPKNDT